MWKSPLNGLLFPPKIGVSRDREYAEVPSEVGGGGGCYPSQCFQ